VDIAILGAPGCVGKASIRTILTSRDHSITASYRTQEEIPDNLQSDLLTWRQVDLLDPASAERFLQGAEALIYLIHSLGAKNFEELDIRLAEAAGSACQRAGIRKIVYLGGIVPDTPNASPHLISRMKTGLALAQYNIPVAEVRASILLATCSMSYQIVYHLAKRLPVMVTPRWLNSLCAPIALNDAADFLCTLLSRRIQGHEIFEIGGDVVRYRDILSLCSKSIRGIENIIVPLPLIPIALTSRWIQLITGVPNSVGTALAEGLKSSTIPQKNRFREVTGRDPVGLDTVLKELAGEMKKLHG
jgi:uncharacterized protein YbjT (DUF2867 family)